MDLHAAHSGPVQGVAAPRQIESKKEAAIAKSAEDFEAMFMTQMLQPMWQEVEVDPMFGGGAGEEVFRGFMTQEFGRLAARTGTLGITGAVRSELLRIQEKQSS